LQKDWKRMRRKRWNYVEEKNDQENKPKQEQEEN
jgi:hypothetical protein